MIPVDFFDAAQSLPTTSTREDPLPRHGYIFVSWVEENTDQLREKRQRHFNANMSSLAPFSMWKILFAQGMNWLVGAGKLDISAQSLRSSSCSWIWEYYLVHSAWQLTQYGKVIFETAVKICENVSTQPTGSSEEQHQNAIWKQKRPHPLPFKPPHRPIKMSTTIRSTRIQRFPNVCSMVFQNK